MEKATLNPKKRGLGRGLDALFDDEESTYGGEINEAASGALTKTRQLLGVDELNPGRYQPRRDFTEENLKELSESIAQHGVLQPLIVRPLSGGSYEIVAGERRWRAAQIAQLHEVPVIVRDLDDKQTLEIALIENLQREDLNPVDEAQGYVRMVEEFGYTQEKAAAILGKSRSHLANMIRLTKLPQKVLEMLKSGDLTAGHARVLVTADEPLALAQTIIGQGLSVRAAEKLAAGLSGRDQKSSGKTGAKSSSKGASPNDVDVAALEAEISAALGMNVRFEMSGEQSGVMKIDFRTLDQLDDILHRLSHYPGRTQTG